MLIHAHELIRPINEIPEVGGPIFYNYDYFELNPWNEFNNYGLGWNTNAEGIQLGFKWTPSQIQSLRQYTPYKTYELIKGCSLYPWIGVERSGYLLPEGFLPLRIAYRRSDNVDRFIMPGNVGFLYNYLLKLTTPMVSGIAPSLQMALDVDPRAFRTGEIIHNYSNIQKLIPTLIHKGPHLAWDIRNEPDAVGEMLHMSQALDMLAGEVYRDHTRVIDWINEYIMVEPSARDRVILLYPHGPIPMDVVKSWYVPGVIDTTVPKPLLRATAIVKPFPDHIVQKLLSVISTDVCVMFSINDNVIENNPTVEKYQSRFGAYIPTNCDRDLALIREIMYDLLAYQNQRTCQTMACFKLTCNEEVIVDLNCSDNYSIFYTNLAHFSNPWYGVAQTPLFVQGY